MNKQPKKNTLTKKQTTEFFNYCKEFQKELGLNSYRIYYETVDTSCFYSRASIDYPSGMATITLTLDYPEIPTSKSLRDTAFHEMLHILLGQYNYVASARFCNESEIKDCEEHIVNTLEQYFSAIT